MGKVADIIVKSLNDVEFETNHVANRPLRGPQAEVVRRVEAHVAAHTGGVMSVKLPRQTGKNDISALIHRRHLLRRQFSKNYACWIRTAPTHKPQIVNSKKRLREFLRLKDSNVIGYPLFGNRKLIKEEGYIWRLGNAAIEFLSSGPQSSVVGATASTCLDMDEAHKVNQAKFDEDFAPFTANTDAATVLWGVGGNGLDTLQTYEDKNKENGQEHLNIRFPCEIWMECHEPYRRHVEGRVNILGWDHPIIQTQYRLNSIAAIGRFLNQIQIQNLMSGNHERELYPRPGKHYEMIVDIAAGNEDFNPDDILQGFEDVTTDSTGIWIYEVTQIVAANGVFPIILIRNCVWLTGTSLSSDESTIIELMRTWGIQKCTIDAIGVGRQIAESVVDKFGKHTVNAYHATSASVSEDCYDLLARLNYDSIKMFNDDNSVEHKEASNQVGWTQYAADKGKMKLRKPKADQHIDLVKALTYINQNNPIAGLTEIYIQEASYD